MDKTRDAMNGNQRMLLNCLESLIPENNVLMGIAEFQSRLGNHSVPKDCLLYTSPSPRDMRRSRMPSSA